MNVLLIGGYLPLLKALKRGLEEEGFRVDVTLVDRVANGYVPAGDYGAIVLDVCGPQESGRALLTRWRRAGLHTHVVILSQPADSNHIAACPSWSAEDWLTKPFELEVLLARLQARARGDRPAQERMSGASASAIAPKARGAHRRA